MLPWVSIETSPIGTVRPCCLAIDEITDTNGDKYSLNTTPLSEIYHSAYMQDLRIQFLKGEQPKTCDRCWKEEDAGRISKRINSRIKMKHHYDSVDWQNTNPDQLWFIDLKLGNICNLKCRICGSWSSSPWAIEEMAYTPTVKKKEHLAYTFLKQGAWPRDNNQFWENLKSLLPSVKYFEFTGGEPFLIKEQFELLQYAVDNNFAKDISIHYNTNGTVFPDRAELWDKFKHVEIALSIDNLGDRFEYERYGAKWDEVQLNLSKFFAMQSSKLEIQLCITINVQNVYYLPEICDWIKSQPFSSVYFNMLHDSQHMNIGQMTSHAKELVIDRLSSHQFDSAYQSNILQTINFINNGSGSDGTEFVAKMKQTDDYRKQSMLTTHGAIARAMGYE